MDSSSSNSSKPAELLEEQISMCSLHPLGRDKTQPTCKHEGDCKYFVHLCAKCKKQMHHNQEVYMYKDEAFCCHPCRAKVMASDIEFNLLQLKDKPKLVSK